MGISTLLSINVTNVVFLSSLFIGNSNYSRRKIFQYL